MTKDDALKLALDVLDRTGTDYGSKQWEYENEAITAIKEALAQDEQGICAGGCPPETQVAYKAAIKLADWLSAALDDPKVCDEYKRDINAWFDAAMPYPVFVFDPALAQPEQDCKDGSCDCCWTEPALAQPEQEPVACDWSVFNTGAEVWSGLSLADAVAGLTPDRLERGWSAVCVIDKDNPPLYTTPPKREWIGLPEEQFLEAARLAEAGNYLVAFQRIQQWLKEKNS